MSIIENPKISIEELNKLEERIKQNNAGPNDYDLLDSYLSFLGVKNYIITRLREKNINSYEDFIYQRKTSQNSAVNMLVGGILGVVSYLRKHISGKL